MNEVMRAYELIEEEKLNFFLVFVSSFVKADQFFNFFKVLLLFRKKFKKVGNNCINRARVCDTKNCEQQFRA
jgi:hypothetical protein